MSHEFTNDSLRSIFVTTAAAETWAELEPPYRVALDLAWQSARAGSLGIGAVITDADGTVVATGRNRLMEHEPGEDLLAGTSLAHAEMNALGKLRWRGHDGARADHMVDPRTVPDVCRFHPARADRRGPLPGS